MFKRLSFEVCTVSGLILSEMTLALEPLYFENFESHAAGADLHNVGGWQGWDGAAGVSAPVSDVFASSGSNSVEVIGSADLVQEFDIVGGKFVLTAMQYIPSGTTGVTYFILLNQYGATNDWSTQTQYNLDTGGITPWTGAQDAVTIQYDQWIQTKREVDLDENTVVEYYNGAQIDSRVWDLTHLVPDPETSRRDTEVPGKGANHAY